MTRNKQRTRGWLAGAAALGLVATGLGVTAAQADHLNPPFEIDGTVPDAPLEGHPVPVEFQDGHLKDQELGPLNGSRTKLGVIHTAVPPMLNTTNPNAQVDIDKVWITTDVANDGDAWVYLGFERDSNKGSGVLAWEFQHNQAPVACDYATETEQELQDLIDGCNPWANRAAGDFMLVFDGQGTEVKIILRTWFDDNGTLKLDDGEQLNADVAEAMLSADKTKGEARVNLTATIFSEDPTNCETIGNIIPGTITGNSDTADYKDTVLAPIADAVTISNCGSVKITKVTDPAGKSGDFTWTLARTDSEDIVFTEPDDGDIVFDGTSSASSKLAGDGDSDTVIDLKPGENYTLDETIVGNTFKLEDITCANGDDEWDVTDPAAVFTVRVSETTECVITNKEQPGTLIVEKVVVNDNGGDKVFTDFSFTVNGDDPTTFEGDGQNEQEVNAGDYTVVEPTVAGYTTTYTNSENPSADCNKLFVPAGETVTCTVTNNDQPGTLIVEKVIVNDNGGDKEFGDFSFTVNGGDPITFNSKDGVNEQQVNAGNYTVLERPADGYKTSYTNTVNKSTDCNSLAIGNGETVTCTITNDDQKASPRGTTVQSWVLHDKLRLSDLRAGAGDADESRATFRLYSDDQCINPALDAEGVPFEEEAEFNANGVARTTTGFSATETGFYYWTAQFSGDLHNNGFTTECGDEVTQVQAKDAKVVEGKSRDDLILTP